MDNCFSKFSFKKSQGRCGYKRIRYRFVLPLMSNNITVQNRCTVFLIYFTYHNLNLDEQISASSNCAIRPIFLNPFHCCFLAKSF